MELIILLGGIILFIIFAVLVFFTFPQFSPIPYYPSNSKDLALILKGLSLQNDETVVDCGAGEGLVIFAGATQAFQKNLNTQFIAVELNPILVAILHIRRFFHPNKKNVKILYADLFTLNLKLQTKKVTFYFYISPWLLEKAMIPIKEITEKKRIVSYFYEIKSLTPTRVDSGIHKLYIYENFS